MEHIEERKKRVKKIIAKLKELFPEAKTSLHYSNNFELLVAVMLSAQCTDKMVNKVTEKLFEKYKIVEDYAKADINEFEQDIRSTGFYHTKAKNIIATAKIINEQYKGKVPDAMECLLRLPGVARKTANVVLGNAYGKVEGIAVDTHVRRLSKLLGLTKNDSPEKIEQDLMQIVPREEWLSLSLRLIEYGRQYCSARKHDHNNCPLSLI